MAENENIEVSKDQQQQAPAPQQREGREGRGPRGGRGGRGRRPADVSENAFEKGGEEIAEKVVYINRSSKVVKGGRRFSFTAVVVVGDRSGHVGAGMGKANEVPDAIRKGAYIARKNLIRVPMNGSTLPHEADIRLKAAHILMKPASPGTGLIAGGGVRAVMEMAGVKDVLAKSLGSNNIMNVVQATINALSDMKDPRVERSRRLAAAGKGAQ